MLVGLLIAVGFMAGAKIWRLSAENAVLRTQLALLPTTAPVSVVVPPYTSHIDATTFPGAGYALKSPPTQLTTVLQRLDREGTDHYRFPIGWFGDNTKPGLLTFRLVGDVNHVLITGQSDSGKDNLAFNMLAGLVHTYSPEKLSIAFIDGKGLDWSDWRHKDHTFLLATKLDEVGPAMAAITRERERRYTILERAGVKKWEQYQGDDLPLLIVFVSELKLLETATSKRELQQWLEVELVAARAFGIRFVLATQTATNLSTTWRSQIGLYLAGYQPFDSQNEPNCGLSANDLTQLGTQAVAPSALPAPANQAQGIFLAVKGTIAINVRTSFIDDAEQTTFVKALPEKILQKEPARLVHQPVHISQSGDHNLLLQMLHDGVELLVPVEPHEEPSTASESEKEDSSSHKELRKVVAINAQSLPNQQSSTHYVELPLPDDEIPFEEQRRIIEASTTVNNKSQLCQKLYGTTGGVKYTQVRKVCDALGLFGATPSQQVA